MLYNALDENRNIEKEIKKELFRELGISLLDEIKYKIKRF